MPDDTTQPTDPNATNNEPVGTGDDTKLPGDGDTPFTPPVTPGDDQYTDHPATDSGNDETEKYNDGVAAAAGEDSQPDSGAVGGFTPPANDGGTAPAGGGDTPPAEDTTSADDSQNV